MRRRSRLSRQRDKSNKKTIILSIIGIIFVLFILFKFGLESLINFSLFLSGNNSTENSSLKNKTGYVSPPVLDPLPVATNSARIVISGIAKKDKTIILYINKLRRDNTTSDSDGKFTFEENLSKGENLIQATVKKDDNESDYSNFYTVLYQNSPPKLEILSPSEGASYKKEDKSAQINGQTDAGVTITINGFFAVIDDENNFSYILPLHDGDNEIKIKAVDQAGNTTEKTIKVNYSP
ncbi:MAG: hypothetical protein COU25_00450 [Candidatus Levybacteria bacterium CG10_big_fil_rev_8_21_14_0_10_35_13]|nr:MAG: hypothetical protein COU25_00450 [Candidatus Levybacteria bacterium CG10_big_fil_rev_8_21_14_0_10_35_13]